MPGVSLRAASRSASAASESALFLKEEAAAGERRRVRRQMAERFVVDAQRVARAAQAAEHGAAHRQRFHVVGRFAQQDGEAVEGRTMRAAPMQERRPAEQGRRVGRRVRQRHVEPVQRLLRVAGIHVHEREGVAAGEAPRGERGMRADQRQRAREIADADRRQRLDHDERQQSVAGAFGRGRPGVRGGLDGRKAGGGLRDR